LPNLVNLGLPLFVCVCVCDLGFVFLACSSPTSGIRALGNAWATFGGRIVDWKFGFSGSESFVGQKSIFYWIKLDFY